MVPLGDSAQVSSGSVRGTQPACSHPDGHRVPAPPPLSVACLCPTDLRFSGGEQDAGSTPELTQGLPAELDAHVAGMVRALQDNMQRVLERLSELEMLTSTQVCAVPCGELPCASAGWLGCDAPTSVGQAGRAWLRCLQTGSPGWPGCGETSGFGDTSRQGGGQCCSDPPWGAGREPTCRQGANVQAGCCCPRHSHLPWGSWPGWTRAAPSESFTGALSRLNSAYSLPLTGMRGQTGPAWTPKPSSLAGGRSWDQRWPASRSGGELEAVA